MSSNKFKKKSKSTSKIKKLPPTLSEEIATIQTTAQMYAFCKKILNPDEVLRKTGHTIAVFRKLENEGQVATCIESRNAGVTSMKWRLNFEEDKNKDFYTALLKRLDVHSIITDILKAPLYGYQPIEVCWGIDESGYVVPVDITAKPQEWFEFTTDNELCFKKKGIPDGLIIKPGDKKFLLPRCGTSLLNPYGKSILARCFWEVIFKKGAKDLWMRFAERYGMPFIYGKYPDGMSDEEIQHLLTALENMIQDAVAAIPDNSTIEILEADGRSSSSDIYERLVKEADRSIAKNILGQTLTTETGDSGSYALGNVHQQVRQDIIDSDVRLVETQFNILLKWVNELNFNGSCPPEFELYINKGIDKTVAERDKILSETGISFTKEYYKKTYNLDDEDFALRPTSVGDTFSEKAAAGVPGSAGAGPANGNTTTAAADINNDDIWEQNLIDGLTDYIGDGDFSRIIEPRLSAVISHFAQNRDIDEAMDALSVLYPQDGIKSLEETLTKALFLAEVIADADTFPQSQKREHK